MKAIRIHEFGGPEVLRLEEIPEPQPGKGEIRIKVFAAGVNPLDWKVRQGLAGKPPLPLVMGVDVSGIVDAQGPEGSEFLTGDEVYAKLTPPNGGYAEYAVANVSQAAMKPKSISFAEAAAIPTAGLAAWQSIFDIAKLEKGQSILIHGAAGGVGSFAVQFARWKGAYIIGTASGDHLQFLKSLGADQVIDYKTQRFETVAHDMDVVLDTVGGDTFERSWGVLKPGGILVTTVAAISEGAPEAHGVRAERVATTANGRELSQIASVIDESGIKPVVATVLLLSEARKAQEMSESHHIKGKIVLQVADRPN